MLALQCIQTALELGLQFFNVCHLLQMIVKAQVKEFKSLQHREGIAIQPQVWPWIWSLEMTEVCVSNLARVSETHAGVQTGQC